MNIKFRRKKFIYMILFITIFTITWIIFMNELFVTTGGLKRLKIETNIILKPPELDKNLLHNFEIYIKRGNHKALANSDNINYNFFVNISDKIGGYRELPDTRFEECDSEIYDLIPNDSTVSVIIAYYNEARSTLLRTIVSILQRTNKKYLKEIIVIDDFNKDVNQGHDLQFIPLIKLIRNPKRLGVIESRNIGAKLATSKYIFFLDSHCEVNIGWLEPLLFRLYLYPGTAVSPVLDIINTKTFNYQQSRPYLKGGFDWKLNFNWIPMTEEERLLRIQQNENAKPYGSPVFSGGIFMISKEWFLKLQGFNPHLKVWGGESIEMSIKLWLCGGQIEIVPCSRVGHVFMQEHSFEFPTDENVDTYLSNVKVIVESWFDEYKHFFYTMKPKAISIPTPDLNFIREMRTNLKCRPFSWYLGVIFPELKLPNEEYIAFGKISSGNKCLSIQKIRVKNNKLQQQQQQQKSRLIMKNCHDTDVPDWYLHSTTGKLSTKSGIECINVIKKIEKVIVENCNNYSDNYTNINNNNNNNNNNNMEFNSNDSYFIKSKKKILSSFLPSEDKSKNILLDQQQYTNTQRWIRSGENLIHKDSQLCLDNFVKDLITVSLCRRGNPSQMFSFAVELQKL